MNLSGARVRQVGFCVATGFVMATFFVAWISLLYLAGGTRAFEDMGTTFLGAVLSYYAAGIIGGAMVGVLLPLARTFLGTMLIGATASLVLFVSGQTALKGAIWNWDRPTLVVTTVIALVFGIVVGPLAAREVRR